MNEFIIKEFLGSNMRRIFQLHLPLKVHFSSKICNSMKNLILSNQILPGPNLLYNIIQNIASNFSTIIRFVFAPSNRKFSVGKNLSLKYLN